MDTIDELLDRMDNQEMKPVMRWSSNTDYLNKMPPRINEIARPSHFSGQHYFSVARYIVSKIRLPMDDIRGHFPWIR